MLYFEGYEDFTGAVLGGQVLILSGGEYFMSFETDEGIWFAVRPRNEEDAPGPINDPWRPVGLIEVENMVYPIRVLPIEDLFQS